MPSSDLGGTRKWWTLATVCTGVFMLLLDLTVVNVALPDIEHSFHASLSDLQWVVSAYALALAAFLLTGGSLADLYGRRLLFATGIVLFTTGSLLCGLADGSLFLMIARGAQGVGGAVMFATALALLAQAFQGSDRGIALGVFGAVTGIAVAIGPVLGGVLTTDLSWRWIFFVNVPIGAVALAMTLLRVDESRNPQARHPDWIGFVSFSASLAALVFGLIESQRDGWGSVTVIGSLAASAALLVIFLVAELAQREPMLDLGLLRVPTFGGGLIAALVLNGALYSQVTYLVIYLENSLGYSAVATGVRFLPFTCAIFVAAGVAGRLTTRLPRRGLMGTGFLLVGAGLLLMRGLTPSSGWTHLLAGMIVSGIGGGLVGTPLISTAVGVVAPARAGMASGINTTLRQVGVAIGVAGFGTILTSHVRASVVGRLSATPLAPHAQSIAHAIAGGGAGQAIAKAPPPLRGVVAESARGALAGGLNTVLLVAAVIGFAAAATSLLLIRERDFVETELAADEVEYRDRGGRTGDRKHRVVVVGGGFAGLRVVRGLRHAPVEVTLVDRQNFTLFQPLVYQVATGALAPAEIAMPHRSLLRRQTNARVLLAEVVGFDLEAREVVAERRAGVAQTFRLGYDTLVVATGAHYSYFGHEEWQAHAPELKSLDGAIEIRDRVFSAFEAAELSDDEQLRREWLTFVVVGGGPTGVEMAGQIAELGHDALPRDFRSIHTEQTRVLLVEANDRLLGAFPPSLSSKAGRSLEQLGVTPLVGHTVVDVDGSGVAIRRPDGTTERVGARTVIWAAGVAASGLAGLLAEAAGVEPDRTGRVPVQLDFTLPFHPEVFAVGDMAREMPAPLPGLAPVAIQEGRWVARAIRARLRDREPRPFRYRDKGNLATIGRLRAVADVKGLHFAGFPAWALWLLIHLFYLAGRQNRVLVVIRWTISFLTRGRGARLVVAPTDPARVPAERREAA